MCVYLSKKKDFATLSRFRKVEDGAVWVFTGVCGPFTKNERECLWDEIGAIRGLWEEPWCVGDDFNVILSQRERNRQRRSSNEEICSGYR